VVTEITEVDVDHVELLDMLLALILSQRGTTWRVDREQMEAARKEGLIVYREGDATYFGRVARGVALCTDHGIAMTEGGDDE